MILNATKDDINSAIEDKSNIILLDFYANWCGPCKRLTPELEKMEDEFSNIKFFKINVDEFQDLTEEYNITCMPTIIFIKNSKIFNRIEGCDIEGIRNTLMKIPN